MNAPRDQHAGRKQKSVEMTKTHFSVLLAGAGLLVFACSASDGTDSNSSGAGAAQVPSGGAKASGGNAPVAGNPSGIGGSASGAGSAGSPVVSTGGQAGSGATAGSATGGAGSGGTSSGGTSNGGASGGGVSGAGVGGGMAAAGAGGGTSGGVAKPSAGCSKGAGRPSGGAVSVAGDHYFAFPESYDGKKPLPVLFGFHGCGSGNRGTNKDDTEWMNLTKSSSFATEYVRAVPVSSSTGGCWTYGTDITRVIKAYDDLLANYCVDTGRVFATGHSSGSQFLVQIFTTKNKADAQHLNFKGVAPVAASDYGAMAGPIPAMYIQGKMDKERGGGDGHETVARFRTANSCSASGGSTPYSAVMGCQSGSTTVNPGCVAYDGCAAPTIWCSHNDPAYSGTMHGVPCFGVKAMFDFFQSLP